MFLQHISVQSTLLLLGITLKIKALILRIIKKKLELLHMYIHIWLHFLKEHFKQLYFNKIWIKYIWGYIWLWSTGYNSPRHILLTHCDRHAIFNSPGPKVQVNYCHHLASVVCKLFTFQASSPKPLDQLEPNLAGMFLGWSSTKFLLFVPVAYSTWLPGPIICSDWLKFQRSSSLKLMNWLNPNCKWMIIGMCFTKFLFFMPIGNPRWPPPQYID
jgi:hypothetical protein